MSVSPVCLKCGIIKKSGKTSCCGRGGSWFTNCGGAGVSKLRHTWYEGIQTCKARSQSKTIIVQYSNATHEGVIDTIDFKSVSTFTKSFKLTSYMKTTTHDPVHTSVSTPMITPGCEKLFNFIIFTSVFYMSL